MNILLIAAIVAAGPCNAALERCRDLTPRMSVEEWKVQVVGNTTIELPTIEAIETEAYTRTAPANYKTPMPTKTVPRWCPASPARVHGYNCGMTQAVEDLAGHLQSVHGVDLEALNRIGRAAWQDYHDDLHWCEEPEARQEAFLHPQPAAKSSGCGPGGCPQRRTRGFF